MIPKNVKHSDFASILYSYSLREYKKPNFKIGDRFLISRYDLPFRKGFKPQFKEEVFEIVPMTSRKPPTYTIKDEQEEIIRAKFHQKEMIKII